MTDKEILKKAMKHIESLLSVTNSLGLLTDLEEKIIEKAQKFVDKQKEDDKIS